MKKLVVMITALIIIASSGCVVKKGLNKPTIIETTHRWGNVTYGSTEIVTQATIKNPNPITMPLKKLYLEFLINSMKLGESTLYKTHKLPANQTSNISFSTYIDNGKIPDAWISHIKNGEKSTLNLKGCMLFDLKVVDYEAPLSYTVNVSTDILYPLNNFEEKTIYFGPFNHFSITIKSISAEWGSINYNTTTIKLGIKVHNDNLVPIIIPKMNYEFTANGIKIAKGSSESKYTIAGNSDKTIDANIFIDNSMIDEWWVSHIQNRESTDLLIKINAEIQIEGQELFEIEIFDGETTITTHIFD